jgi:hypothetical protein
MSTIKSLYGTNNQAITCTITSLTNNSMRQSTAIDNTTNLFLDALVQVKIKTNASGTSGSGYVAIYAYGSADGGTDYTDGATGSDAAFTSTSPPNVRLIGIINAVANATTYIGGPISVAAAFGGILPDHWGIIIENQTGATLDASVGSSWYQGYSNQVV